MARRGRQPKPEMLGEILQRILKKRNIPHTPTDRRLLDLWRRSVGPQIAAQTYPDRLRQDTLFVRVSAPIWMHQLQFLKEEIVGKLNALAGKDEVRNLQFTIGEIPAPAPDAGHEPPPSPPVPLTGRDRTMMRESLDTVRDPELRAILERVMQKEIGHRRRRQ